VEVYVNKGELVDAIANDANISKTDAESALNAFINSVQSSISSGEKVTLPGFGTFSPALRKARTGMDPRTKFKTQVQGS
jgi:DNA-binding protein HU-beta